MDIAVTTATASWGLGLLRGVARERPRRQRDRARGEAGLLDQSREHALILLPGMGISQELGLTGSSRAQVLCWNLQVKAPSAPPTPASGSPGATPSLSFWPVSPSRTRKVSEAPALLPRAEKSRVCQLRTHTQ